MTKNVLFIQGAGKGAYEVICPHRLDHCEWAWDDEGDGWFETHTNSNEGLWTELRNFLRPFRGVSKHYLHGYLAIHEFRVNLKGISPTFIAVLVHRHSF